MGQCEEKRREGEEGKEGREACLSLLSTETTQMMLIIATLFHYVEEILL